MRQSTNTTLAGAKLVNRYNGVLQTDGYLLLSEEGKRRWWREDFPDMRKLIDEYEKKVEEDLKHKYNEKKQNKIKQTNRLAALNAKAAEYNGPLCSEKIEANFFEQLLTQDSTEVVRILGIECSILRILHPTDSTLFRTKQLDKTTRKQVPIDPVVIIQNLREYFLNAPESEASASAEFVAYFQNTEEMST